MAELRIGDADREAAVAELGEHFALGRLTKEEHDERTDAAWSARTRSDLAPLFADLPGSGAPDPGAPPAPVGQPVRRGPAVPWAAVKAVLAALLVLTVVTHLPFLLLAGGVWFYLSRRHGAPPPPWVGRGHRGLPPGVR